MFDKMYLYYISCSVAYTETISYQVLDEPKSYTTTNNILTAFTMTYEKNKIKTADDVIDLMAAAREAFEKTYPDYSGRITNFIMLGYTKLDE